MKTISLSASLCRWSARIISVLVLTITVVIAVGEGMPVGRLMAELLTHPLALESVGFLGLVLMVGGLLASWRWEIAGGITSLVGVGALFGPTMANGKITWFFAALAAPGVLYLVSYLLQSRASAGTKSKPS